LETPGPASPSVRPASRADVRVPVGAPAPAAAVARTHACGGHPGGSCVPSLAARAATLRRVSAPAPWLVLRRLGSLVRFSHTIFGLPFALAAVALAHRHALAHGGAGLDAGRLALI